MTEPRYSSNVPATLARAAAHAESTRQRSRDLSKTIRRLVNGKFPFAIEQTHQQAVCMTVAHLSQLQMDVAQRLERVDLMLEELSSPSPENTGSPLVISLSQRRLRRYGAHRLASDWSARVEQLCDEVDMMNHSVETEFRALSDIIHR